MPTSPSASPAKPLVIFLMGPTASGKTDLAIGLREHLPVELISVDSALVYRGMDIGSAKPSAEELAKAPHRLIDIRDPAEPYSAADFCADARREIDAIVAAGKIPLLVGGTMLYFKALLEGMADMPGADEAVRAEIAAWAEKDGWPAVHRELARVDPVTAAGIHPNHSQRISRALEVYRVRGKTMPELRQAQSANAHDFCTRFNVVQTALAPRDRAILHERIALRFSRMIDKGFVEEVRRLYLRGDLATTLPAVRAVGYRQVWSYLDGEVSLDEAVEQGIAATRQLAKRQLTWLRGWPAVNWLYTEDNIGKPLKNSEIIEQALKLVPTTII